MDLEQLMHKDQCIEQNIDPKGNEWGVVHIKGSALYEVRVKEGNQNTKTPEICAGRFTKPTLAHKKIKEFLTKAWETSDEIRRKNERKTQAAKEASKKEDVI